MANESRRSSAGGSGGTKRPPRRSPRAEKGTAWLLKPPGRDQANVYISVGPKVKLSPELRRALENAARLLGGEVPAPGGPESKCDEVYIHNCVAHVDCRGVTW